MALLHVGDWIHNLDAYALLYCVGTVDQSARLQEFFDPTFPCNYTNVIQYLSENKDSMLIIQSLWDLSWKEEGMH